MQKLDMKTLEARLRNKDDHINELKKDLATTKAASVLRQAEKDAMRAELVAAQSQLIILQCELVDHRKTNEKTGSEDVDKLKREIERLNEEEKV